MSKHTVAVIGAGKIGELVPLARAVARLKTVTPARLAERLAFTG